MCSPLRGQRMVRIMSGNLALKPEPAPLVACTISRNVQEFDLLIEDMEAELGEGWGDLTFEEAGPFFGQPDAAAMEFVAIAVDKTDEPQLAQVGGIIKAAKAAGLRIILIADGLGPMVLHEMLRDGADDFVPYPLPEGALAEAIGRIQSKAPATPVQTSEPVAGSASTPTPAVAAPLAFGSGSGGEPVVLAIHGLAGGVGATTLAVNLAWELANIEKEGGPRVCLIDLDLQFGSVSTYLDLPRRELIYEILADTASMDEQAFRQGLLTYQEKLSVFTAPAEIMPLDLIEPGDVAALIGLAKQCFDIVIIDMPTTVVQWTETVLDECDIYFAMVEMELRSAQNVLRLVRTLKAEDLPVEKVSWILNRAPKDMASKSRVKRMAESLEVEFRCVLPDGGKMVTETNDHGVPLMDMQPKIPLRKEIGKLADTLWAAAQGAGGELEKASKSKGLSLFSFGRG